MGPNHDSVNLLVPLDDCKTVFYHCNTVQYNNMQTLTVYRSYFDDFNHTVLGLIHLIVIPKFPTRYGCNHRYVL